MGYPERYHFQDFSHVQHDVSLQTSFFGQFKCNDPVFLVLRRQSFRNQFFEPEQWSVQKVIRRLVRELASQKIFAFQRQKYFLCDMLKSWVVDNLFHCENNKEIGLLTLRRIL